MLYRFLTVDDVVSFPEEYLNDIHELLVLLGPVKKVNRDYLVEVVKESRVVVAIDKDSTIPRIVGIACLAIVTAITSRVGFLTHIAVDGLRQRKGVGSVLVHLLNIEAKRLGLKRIDLTSHSSRASAQQFWIKQGFVKRETNNFRFNLTS